MAEAEGIMRKEDLLTPPRPSSASAYTSTLLQQLVVDFAALKQSDDVLAHQLKHVLELRKS